MNHKLIWHVGEGTPERQIDALGGGCFSAGGGVGGRVVQFVLSKTAIWGLGVGRVDQFVLPKTTNWGLGGGRVVQFVLPKTTSWGLECGRVVQFVLSKTVSWGLGGGRVDQFVLLKTGLGFWTWGRWGSGLARMLRRLGSGHFRYLGEIIRGALRFCQPVRTSSLVTPLAMNTFATLALGASLFLSLGLRSTSAASPEVKAKAKQIDSLVAKDLEKNHLKPNAMTTDEVFVRRVYLDVIGRVPTRKETLDFLNSKEATKREKLIDTLLASDGYTQNFYNFWADVLRLQSSTIGGGQTLAAGFAYEKWLKESLSTNKPYDAMVRELIDARGATYENGAVGFYVRDYNMPLDNMAVTTQIFLGTSIVCAQCHNHPFDKWSQLDYYQMAAHTYGMTATNGMQNRDVYKTLAGGGKKAKATATVAKGKAGPGQIAASKPAKPSILGNYKSADLQKALTEILRPLRYNHVVEEDKKQLKLPHDYKYDNGKPNEVIEPTIPTSFSKDGKVTKNGVSPSLSYGEWMTSKDNPRFSLVIANRLWRKLMGIGLIEPVDEITDSTVPSNPALMTFLEETIKSQNFDMKEYLRMVLNSKTYQRAAMTQELELGEQSHFQGPMLRRMSAEQIWDTMVALYKPEVDKPSKLHQVEQDTSLRRIEWLDRALNCLTTEEAIEGAKKIADVQKKLAQDVRDAQHQLSEATKAKDDAGIRQESGGPTAQEH